MSFAVVLVVSALVALFVVVALLLLYHKRIPLGIVL